VCVISRDEHEYYGDSMRHCFFIEKMGPLKNCASGPLKSSSGTAVYVQCNDTRGVRVEQGSQTRGPRRHFVRPPMLFGKFQIINIYVAKCLEKRRREIIESNLNDTQCGILPGRSNTDHTSLISKILRNLGSMLKMSSHALSTSRKNTTALGSVA